MTLQAVLDCAQASFNHYDENWYVWANSRSHCKDLLCTDDLSRYQECCDWEVFEEAGAENCQAKWEELVKKCDPDIEDINLNN